MSAERNSVLHSWCVQADWDAPTIIGGRGARFWDASGRTFLDMSSLSECMNLGHQHPALVKAIQAQAATLCFTTAAWGAEPRARLAERLLEKSGFEGGRVFFTLGGADSVEHAVKFDERILEPAFGCELLHRLQVGSGVVLPDQRDQSVQSTRPCIGIGGRGAVGTGRQHFQFSDEQRRRSAGLQKDSGLAGCRDRVERMYRANGISDPATFLKVLGDMGRSASGMRSSVRTRESPKIAMVCSKSPM